MVGIFPNRDAILRLLGMVLVEQNDEWAIGRRYFSAESMAEIDAGRKVTGLPAAAAD